MDERAFFRLGSEAKCAHDLHCGRCSPEDFAREAVREFKLNVTPETFLDDYKAWFRGPYEGALELLEGLRLNYRVACLSNANVLDVIKTLDLPPGEIAFFDDSLENVEGAVAVGMHGNHVQGFGDLRILLGRMGFLGGRT